MTVGHPHKDRGKPQVITGPEVPWVQQKAAVKKAAAARTDPKWRSITVIHSGGSKFQAKVIDSQIHRTGGDEAPGEGG